MKQALLIIASLAVLALASVLILPSLIVGREGGFKWHEVGSETSFDHRFQVLVFKKIAFPANEWIDPTVVIRAELCDLPSKKVIASGCVRLAEDSDFSNPTIEWRSNSVEIIRFDHRKNQTFSLKF